MACLQQRLVKTGGRLVKHARYSWLLLTEVSFRAPEGQHGNSGFQLNVKELERSRRALDQAAALLRACFGSRR
jgi:hypothetical protein